MRIPMIVLQIADTMVGVVLSCTRAVRHAMMMTHAINAWSDNTRGLVSEWVRQIVRWSKSLWAADVCCGGGRTTAAAKCVGDVSPAHTRVAAIGGAPASPRPSTVACGQMYPHFPTCALVMALCMCHDNSPTPQCGRVHDDRSAFAAR